MDLFFVPATVILDDGSFVLEIALGQEPRKIAGIQKLVQIWISEFLTDPGHHILDMDSGGGVSSLLGKNNNTGHSKSDLKGLITAAIDKTNKGIFEQQGADEDIDDDELLHTAYLLGLESAAEDELDIKIQLVAKSMKSQAVIVPIA
jgi:hypothetical protein